MHAHTKLLAGPNAARGLVRRSATLRPSRLALASGREGSQVQPQQIFQRLLKLLDLRSKFQFQVRLRLRIQIARLDTRIQIQRLAGKSAPACARRQCCVEMGRFDSGNLYRTQSGRFGVSCSPSLSHAGGVPFTSRARPCRACINVDLAVFEKAGIACAAGLAAADGATAHK